MIPGSSLRFKTFRNGQEISNLSCAQQLKTKLQTYTGILLTYTGILLTSYQVKVLKFGQASKKYISPFLSSLILELALTDMKVGYQ